VSDSLSLTQQRAHDSLSLLEDLPLGGVFVLRSETGQGRTTLLRRLYAANPEATLITATELSDALEQRSHPLAVEETIYRLIRGALSASELVIVDDISLIYDVVGSSCGSYPRSELIDAPLTALSTQAIEAGKVLIFGCDSRIPDPLRRRGFCTEIPDLTVDDYAHLCALFFAEAGSGETITLDYKKVFRFAPNLNVYQLKASAIHMVRRFGTFNTDAFIDYLRSQRMTSNVELAEVEAFDLRDLQGVEDVIEALEANIVVPLENDALALELGLKPKRASCSLELPARERRLPDAPSPTGSSRSSS